MSSTWEDLGMQLATIPANTQYSMIRTPWPWRDQASIASSNAHVYRAHIAIRMFAQQTMHTPPV